MQFVQYQYGYIQHTVVQQPVAHTYIQHPSTLSPINVPSNKQLDDRVGFMAVPPVQAVVYANEGDADYGQSLSPTVEFNVDELLEYQRRRSSASTEEKEPLTPAQRRRKAQNRAAYVKHSCDNMVHSLLMLHAASSQRAFRDRKRQRVQDLEAQLSALEVRTNSLESENEKLKHQLLLTRNENEVLRSIAQNNTQNNTRHFDRDRVLKIEDATGQRLP